MASTGASRKRSPSAVRVPTTGVAIRPATDTSTVRPIAARTEAITTRRSPRRPTRISPASPDAASTPIATTLAMPSAKIRSFHFGATPRSIDAWMDPGSQYWVKPIAHTTSNTTMLSSDSRSTLPIRLADRPRMFDIATYSSAPPATTSGRMPSFSSFQKTVRYSEMTTALIAITIR